MGAGDDAFCQVWARNRCSGVKGWRKRWDRISLFEAGADMILPMRSIPKETIARGG